MATAGVTISTINCPNERYVYVDNFQMQDRFLLTIFQFYNKLKKHSSSKINKNARFVPLFLEKVRFFPHTFWDKLDLSPKYFGESKI